MYRKDIEKRVYFWLICCAHVAYGEEDVRLQHNFSVCFFLKRDLPKYVIFRTTLLLFVSFDFPELNVDCIFNHKTSHLQKTQVLNLTRFVKKQRESF